MIQISWWWIIQMVVCVMGILYGTVGTFVYWSDPFGWHYTSNVVFGGLWFMMLRSDYEHRK